MHTVMYLRMHTPPAATFIGSFPKVTLKVWIPCSSSPQFFNIRSTIDLPI